MLALTYIKLFYLSLMQDSLVFCPKQKNIEDVKSPETYGLQGVEDVFINSGSNDKINLWVKSPTDETKPIFIMFHGNTGHFGDVGTPAEGENYDRRYRVKLLQAIIDAGAGFIAVSMRGYGKSEGKPSEKNFDEDIVAVEKYVKEKNYKNLYILGESLGASSALKLGDKIQAEKIVLIAPFANIEIAVTDRYPEFKRVNLKKYLKHKFDNLDLIKNYNKNSQIIIFHDKKDNTTKIYHSDLLVEEGLKNNVNIKLNKLSGGGHIIWDSKKIIAEVLK